jgi:hypothetical protein
MYLYGGSTGSAMGDFHELKLEFRRIWKPIVPSLSERKGNKRSGGGSSSNSASPSFFASNSNEISGSDSAVTGRREIVTPGPRFCHVGVVYDASLYIFGGYDGSNRLELCFSFLSLEL